MKQMFLQVGTTALIFAGIEWVNIQKTRVPFAIGLILLSLFPGRLKRRPGGVGIDAPIPKGRRQIKNRTQFPPPALIEGYSEPISGAGAPVPGPRSNSA